MPSSNKSNEAEKFFSLFFSFFNSGAIGKAKKRTQACNYELHEMKLVGVNKFV